MKQSLTVGAQLLWSGRCGCNNSRYGCTIVMSYIEINKAVSQWLLTFNLCVSVTWPLTCAFHIPCTHTPEIIDMHRGMCDNVVIRILVDDLSPLGFQFPVHILKNLMMSLNLFCTGITIVCVLLKFNYSSTCVFSGVGYIELLLSLVTLNILVLFLVGIRRHDNQIKSINQSVSLSVSQ